LVIDEQTIYAIENEEARPIASMDVFAGYGYRMSNVITADVDKDEVGEPLLDPTQRHVRGTLVNDSGTIYFLGKDVRYPFTSEAIFRSWGSDFSQVVPANSSDLKMPVGPAVEYNLDNVQVGSVVKSGDDETVYEVVSESELVPFTSEEAFRVKGYDFLQVITLPDNAFRKYKITNP
jgi:hypothetical protein